MIKLAIERSIEKEYIERDDLDRRVLRYLVSLPSRRRWTMLIFTCRHRRRRGSRIQGYL